MATPNKSILAEGKYLRLVKSGRWEYAERVTVAGAVVIVAVTPEKKVLLTEQYRVPVNARVIELPAGLVGDIPEQADEEWAAAARRELLEETGYAARSMKKMAGGPISAGFGNELIEIFLATGLKKHHDGGGVDGEEIVVHEVPLATVSAWLKRKARSGMMVDPKVYAGLYFAR
jgi:ADP-ribose pyrophosphatase